MSIQRRILVTSIAILLMVASIQAQGGEDQSAIPSLVDDSEVARPYLTAKDQEFFDLVSQPSDDGYFVFFGAGWCGHCRNFKPTFVKVAEKSANKEMKVNPQMILYEASDRDAITTLFKVNAYPTMFYIRNGKYCPFGGPRDVATLEEFFTRDINREFCKDMPDHYPSWTEQAINGLDDFWGQLKYEYEFYSKEFPKSTMAILGVFAVSILITCIGIIAYLKETFFGSKARPQPAHRQSQAKRESAESKKEEPSTESRRSQVPESETARESKRSEGDESSVNARKRTKRD